MIEVYKKYVHWIVGFLFIAFCMKSCQSYSVERGRQWDEIRHVHQIDSMKQIHDTLNDSIRFQRDSIIYYKYQMIKALNESERLNDINIYLKRTNNRLIDINKEK